jgi:hypothetical protein
LFVGLSINLRSWPPAHFAPRAGSDSAIGAAHRAIFVLIPGQASGARNRLWRVSIIVLVVVCAFNRARCISYPRSVGTWGALIG